MMVSVHGHYGWSWSVHGNFWIDHGLFMGREKHFNRSEKINLLGRVSFSIGLLYFCSS